MSTKLATILADFTTNLASAITVGGTTATLQSATDDDGVALPSGRYFFTIDGENSSKEHFSCQLSGVNLTSLKSISRQGVETSGAVRTHRLGATVTLTDFAHILYMNNLLSGATNLDSTVPLQYDGTASITGANMLATKAYVDSVAVAGAPNATTSVKGILQLATQAQLLAKTATGGTGAALAVTPDIMPSTLLSDYKVDTGSANAYVITPAPAITAYTTGQIFSFKAVNANTTASTLNVNALGTKSIKRMDGSALQANDIKAGQIVVVEYDGTNFIMISTTGNNTNFDGSGLYPAANGSQITNVTISNSFPRGETVNGATTPVPVVLIDDTIQEETLSSINIDFGKVSTGNKTAFGFKLQGAITLTTLKVYLKKQGSPTDNVVFTIETDNAGAPSGTPVTNGTSSTIAGTGLTTSFVLTTVTMGGTVSLSANTQYWLVAKRDSTTSDTNYYRLNGIAAANAYASFTQSTFNASSWSTGDNIAYVQLVCATGSSVSVWRCDTDHANFHMRFGVGVVTTDGVISVSASVIFRGVVSGFTGLTPGQYYYAQDAIGTLGLTPGTTETLIGMAISTTAIAIGIGADKLQYIGTLSLGSGANDLHYGFQKARFMYVTGSSTTGAPTTDSFILPLQANGFAGPSETQNDYAPGGSNNFNASLSGRTLTIGGTGSVSGNAYFFK